MIRLISESQFSMMEEVWNELLQASSADSFFLCHEWLFGWWQFFCDNAELFIVAVYDSQQSLIGLAPLCIQIRKGKFGSRRVLTFIGSGQACPDYLGFILRKGCAESATAEILAYLSDHQERWDEMQWESVAAENPDNQNLLRELERSGWLVASVDSWAYSAQLPGHFDEYLMQLSRGRRYNLRRERRILESDYQVQFQEVLSAEHALKLFDRLYELHKMRATVKKREDGFADPRIRNFHRSLIKANFERGLIRLYTLSLSGRDQAVLYGFVHDGQFFYYQSGINSDFGTISLGSAIVLFAIERAIQSRWHSFDFLRGNEKYKLTWTNVKRPIVHLSLYKRTIPGWIRYGFAISRHHLGDALDAGKQSLAGGSRPKVAVGGRVGQEREHAS